MITCRCMCKGGWALVVAAVGCAPALSSFQPAHVAPQGHALAELGMDVSIPVGTISKTIDAGDSLVEAARTEELTKEQRKTIFDAGIALALNPPSLVQHMGLGYTFVDRLEVAIRYSISAFRAGIRYQFLRQATHGVDLTAGLGAARYTFQFPVSEVLNILKIDDWTRWQIDVPIIVGKSADWYRLWVGPRLMYTRFGTKMTLDLPPIPSTGYAGERVLASVKGNGYYVGGQGGVALGFKRVFLAVELTLVQLFTSAHLDAFGERQSADLDGFIVYPAFGIMGEI